MVSNELNVALNAVNKAAEILLKHFRKIETVEMKGGNPKDIVTEADLEAERAIIKIIQANFGSHNILAEETGFIKKDSPYTWVIDPLDGTGNFAAGLPYFSISIALLKGKQPVVAAISAPVEGELFYAQKGKGAYLASGDGKPFKITVSKTDKLAQSFGIIEAGHNNAVLLKALNILGPQIKRFRVLGSTVLNLASVAAGRVDFFTVARINTHDIAGGMLLVAEAGGKVTVSEPISLDTEKKVTLTASNGLIHQEILQAIKALSY
ncbi:MAG: inositol monophosphatase family protein [Patescibacteria group bacterium]